MMTRRRRWLWWGWCRSWSWRQVACQGECGRAVGHVFSLHCVLTIVPVCLCATPPLLTAFS